jgi:hypothetical protein
MMCFVAVYNGDLPGCSFVLQPEELDIDDEHFIWEAEEDKPAGAVTSN